MELTLENFSKIDVLDFDPGNFVDKTKWQGIARRSSELKFFIDEMLNITNANQNIPTHLANQVKRYGNTFLSFLTQISENKSDLPSEIAKQKEALLKQFDGWCKECLEKTNLQPNQLSLYELYSTLKSLEKIDFKAELTEIKNIKKQIISDKSSIDTILSELQKKVSNITVADYAKIFGANSEKQNKNSKIWLGVGVSIIILFLILLLFTNLYQKYPTEEIIPELKIVKYNLSNLFIKVLLFAVQIFIISFSFKQFSVNKHLSTINKHRQNAMDSFKLFIESISKDDSETRNSLMLQLAKAIYEQTSTGYISDKNQGVNSGIVEITKMIGANRLEQ
jgi:hypothetical protein